MALKLNQETHLEPKISIKRPGKTHMCKSKMAVDATEPISIPPRRTPRAHQSPLPKPIFTAAATTSSSSDPSTSNTASSYKLSSSTLRTWSSHASLSSFKQSLPENPNIYNFAEISSATNSFLATRLGGATSTPSWRCTLRGKDAVVFQRKFHRKPHSPDELRQRLSTICRSHHTSIVKLLGASVSGDHVFLVYEFVPAANLAACLRNPNNPNFTVLSTWLSRMQVAADIAQGLNYIHNNSGLQITIVHNHIKSSSVLVTEHSFNAKICHLGAAQLRGEANLDTHQQPKSFGKISELGESSEEMGGSQNPKLKRSNSQRMQFVEGSKGYMSPEFQATGVATQMSDVYAFGVVLLELLSGQEPFKYKLDKVRGAFIRTSVIDSAQAAIKRRGDLRTWVDGRLKDSYPVEVAEKLTRVALECVHVEPDKRPSMGRVEGKISKLYLESLVWFEKLRVPTDISVSLALR